MFQLFRKIQEKQSILNDDVKDICKMLNSEFHKLKKKSENLKTTGLNLKNQIRQSRRKVNELQNKEVATT